MRQFDYSYLADRTWDNEIISYISKIHEYKGKQELYLRQKPVELNRLIAKVGSGIGDIDIGCRRRCFRNGTLLGRIMEIQAAELAITIPVCIGIIERQCLPYDIGTDDDAWQACYRQSGEKRLLCRSLHGYSTRLIYDMIGIGIFRQNQHFYPCGACRAVAHGISGKGREGFV